jgi:hypothetical protein
MRQMKEIVTVLESRNYNINNIICETMKKFNFKTLCYRAGIRKADGVSASEILTLLLMLPLMALKNVHQLYKSEYGRKVAMQKDAIYRLKNNEKYPWRTLLYAVAKRFKGLVSVENKPESAVSTFVLDDTLIQHVGDKIENISHVFDHVTRKTVYGFKTLVLAFFDGVSTIPLDFSMHAEKKLNRKKSKAQYKKDTDPRSNGAKRRKETKTSKIDQAITMIKRAVKNGFRADYVLCDAWFSSKAFIQTVREVAGGSMHVIAGIRKDRRKYTHNGQLFNANEIIAKLKATGTERRCRSLNIRYFDAIVQYEDVGAVKLFICRYPHQKKWRVFISTDISLSLIEMMKIYGIRWTIEVMFRETKQHLQLNGCQSRDFDAHIAHATITFILYTFLVYLKRMNSYETLGELFRTIQHDVCENTLAERLWELFEELLTFIVDVISANGALNITLLKQSEEYCYVKEIFASSFLFKQMHSVDKSA